MVPKLTPRDRQKIPCTIIKICSLPAGYFGSFEWSSSDGHICYVAEKKQPKTASFFGKKSDSEETKKDEPIKVNSKIHKQKKLSVKL